MLRNNEVQIQIETLSFSKPTDFLQKFQNFGKFSTFKNNLGIVLHGLKSLDIDENRHVQPILINFEVFLIFKSCTCRSLDINTLVEHVFLWK